jgi:dienelactone hydrolase
MKGFLSPRDCDARVQRWTSPHYLSRNDRVKAAGRLCLILPGTGGLPRDYRRVADQAADLGLHALVLRYPNDVSINELASGDVARHEGLRRTVWDGRAREGTEALPEGECLRDRLVSVLAQAARTRPDEGWEAFLTDGDPVWASLAVVGHSLGGGYAALMAVDHALERVVCAGWADWDRGPGELSPWTAQAWKTPSDRRFCMFHRRDELVPESVALAVGASICPQGRNAVVESDDPPYGHARVLWTDLDPAREFPTGSPFHNALAVDVELPRFWDGANMLADAWTYLLVGN